MGRHKQKHAGVTPVFDRRIPLRKRSFLRTQRCLFWGHRNPFLRTQRPKNIQKTRWKHRPQHVRQICVQTTQLYGGWLPENMLTDKKATSHRLRRRVLKESSLRVCTLPGAHRVSVRPARQVQACEEIANCARLRWRSDAVHNRRSPLVQIAPDEFRRQWASQRSISAAHCVDQVPCVVTRALARCARRCMKRESFSSGSTRTSSRAPIKERVNQWINESMNLYIYIHM